ncbi:hypothetical protein EC01288_4564, partial [Escherichia coli 0.1288]
MEQEAV